MIYNICQLCQCKGLEGYGYGPTLALPHSMASWGTRTQKVTMLNPCYCWADVGP